MRVLVRADASPRLGHGHVMRCLSLIRVLREQGVHCAFASRALPDVLRSQLQASGCDLHSLPDRGAVDQGPAEQPLVAADELADLAVALRGQPRWDWLILDHYGLDTEWERGSQAFAERLLVIDDLCERPHGGHLLLDQNLLDATTDVYPVPLGATVPRRLFGPRYALLRPEFARLRLGERPAREALPRLLLFFGAGASGGYVLPILEGLLDLPASFAVVIGGGLAERPALERLAAQSPRLRVHCDTPDMAELIQRADLFLGAGGSITWERACLGLPGLVVALSRNQVAMSQAAAGSGIQEYLGEASAVSPAQWRAATQALLGNPERLAGMRARALALCDGAGAQRVAQVLLEMADAN